MATNGKQNNHHLKIMAHKSKNQTGITTPYIERNLYDFSFDRNLSHNWCNQLANYVKDLLTDFYQLLELANQPIERVPFQLALFRDKNNSNKFKLRLRYDVFIWFDHVLSQKSTDVKVEIAQEYVRQYLSTRDAHDRRKPIDFVDRFDHSDRMRWTRINPRQITEQTLWNRCNKKSVLINGNVNSCQMEFDKSFFIDLIELSRPASPYSYVLQSRSESTRDILLIPTEHVANVEFVKDPNTWRAVFVACENIRQKCNEIQSSHGTIDDDCPLESVYFNFGVWMSAMHQNVLMKDAHAHAHLLLTPEVIGCFNLRLRDLLSQSNRNVYRYIANLKGCYRDPVDYEYQDIIRLQNDRLLSFHIERTDSNIDKIQKSLETIKSELTSIKKNIEINAIKTQLDDLKQVILLQKSNNSSSTTFETESLTASNSTARTTINEDENNNSQSSNDHKDKRQLEISNVKRSKKRRRCTETRKNK